MKERFENALDVKSTILNQGHCKTAGTIYYYTEHVKIKKTRRVVVKIDPEKTEYDELRFRRDEYTKDLAIANAKIESELKSLQDLVSSVKSLIENQSLVAGLEASQASAESELTRTKLALKTYIDGLSPVQRTCVLAAHYLVSGSEYLVETICDAGFDCNALASLGIDKCKIQLLSFALNSGANLDAYVVEDHTLVQRAIISGDQLIINTVLSNTQNFESTLLYSICQGDTAVIKALLLSHPELASSLLFEDLGLLHYAIAYNQMSVIVFLINEYPMTLSKNNSSGESAFKVALRSGSNEIVALVASHVDLTRECLILLSSGDEDLIKRAVDLQLIEADFVINHTKQMTEAPQGVEMSHRDLAGNTLDTVDTDIINV